MQLRVSTEQSKPSAFKRTTAWLILCVFINATLQPLALAAEATPASTGTAAPKDDDKFDNALQRLEQHATAYSQKLDKQENTASEEGDLKTLRDELEALDNSARTDFAAVETHLKENKLPDTIIKRHNDAVAAYKTEIESLKTALTNFNDATLDADKKKLADEINARLQEKRIKQARAPIDPAKLPQRIVKPNKNNKPKTSKAEFAAANLFSNPQVKLAALGDFKFDKLPGANDPAYLSATPEIVYTDAIKAKAQELGYDPVKIYRWVKENIEWIPSWGSIQGADLTLKNLKGNAIDTASLLIALLRTSGIPSRYVHGTIELPAARLMNWAGNFTDVNSAADFISSGGVPLSALTAGGRITTLRMEHVWVEAAIDYYPSRGAINKSADAWVQIDASYKQHEVVPGFDLTTSSPFNVSDYLNQVRAESPVQYYQQQLQSYLDTNQPEKGVGDAMGFSFIKTETAQGLPASLPYKTVIAANRYGAIPGSLRLQLQFQFADASGMPLDGLAFNTVDIAGKRLTLSYIPASPSDEALIASYGGDPYAAPPYALYLKPAIKIDGQIVYTGEGVPMGTQQLLAINYQGATLSASAMPNKLIAGGYYAIATNLQGVNEYVIGDKNARLTQTLTTSPDPTVVDNDALIGEHLYALGLAYYLNNDKSYTGAAKLYNVAQVRILSAGLVGCVPTIRYFFGLPKSASINKIQFDMGLEATQARSKDGNNNRLQQYLAVYGLMGSYSEHHVFEAIHNFDSVSAVKALQAATEQGVPVYTIDQSNFNQLFPLVQLDAEDRQEIQQGVQAGLIAIVPQHEIVINQWRGAGFIIKDPLTAAGVYRISGGLSGGSTTSQNDGFQIVSLFKGAFAWLKDKLDVMTRNFIITGATADAASGEPSDEDIQEKIEIGSRQNLGRGYDEVGRCTGFVSKAYAAAGISLSDLAKTTGTGNPLWTPNLMKLAKALNINGGVRSSSPLVGDIVFFQYTYERSFDANGASRQPNCLLADEEQPTHVGIVIFVDNLGDVAFTHAGSSGAYTAHMSLREPKSSVLNSALRGWPEKRPDGTYCPRDAQKDSNTAEGISPYAGSLFNGYATIRNKN